MLAEFHIVLVDDSPADVKIIERALREAQVGHRLTVLRDGRAALDYFRRLRDPDAPAHLDPDLVLLDLNLPGIDGTQVLVEVKADPDLKAIPVVVLTTSGHEADVAQSYRAGANTFIQKPDEFPRYRDLVTVLRDYWHRTAARSPRPPRLGS